tara:strand:- start:2718 stop:3029 length:312 start_codon:yes stop_codon:yes gene_type:complete
MPKLTEYQHLLLTVFDRPMEESKKQKVPEIKFMNFAIWKHLKEEEFDCLYGILNSDLFNHLNMEQRYELFYRNVIYYNNNRRRRKQREYELNARKRRNKNGTI